MITRGRMIKRRRIFLARNQSKKRQTIKLTEQKLVTVKNKIEFDYGCPVYNWSPEYSSFMPPPSELKECFDVRGLAYLLGCSYKTLSSHIYPSVSKRYRIFEIPKKSGGSRLIESPDSYLNNIQKKLSLEFIKHYRPRISAHGFIKNRSILTNALSHCEKRYVFNIDLKNFFGSIHFTRVRNLLSSYPLSLPISVATVVAHICCKDGRLPQGSPASPIISNMICYKLDRQLQALAKRCSCHYTRYVDDITFSFTCNKEHLPRGIVLFDEHGDVTVGEFLKEFIKENGFKINKDKVRIKKYSQSQEVTGLVVNKKVNVRREFIRKTKSMIYAWKKFGLLAAESEYLKKYNQRKILPRQQIKIAKGEGQLFSQIVRGRVNYIKMIKGANDRVYKRIAYDMSCALGDPDESYLRSPEDELVRSIFVIDNDLTSSQGTAFLLEGIGLVTNYHVVKNIDQLMAPYKIELYRYDEIANKRKVNFVKSDENKDLGIFTLMDSDNDIVPLTIGDSSKIKMGTEILVIGFPNYVPNHHPYINTGRALQKRKILGIDMWLVDTPIIHGNSGGPVFNMNMEVIGVATAGPEEGDETSIQYGFIPINDLKKYFYN
ncbi:MAG: reverse transcriptase domain-containing protein [Desulfotalea sp.]